MQSYIANLVKREMTALKRQIALYPSEELIWELPTGISNSAGTLTLHLTGNLRHYIGAMLGNSGYVRRRDAEFADRNTPRAELLAGIDQAIADVQASLAGLEDDQLDQAYPDRINGNSVNTREWLLHLLSHMSYHLGQIDYHRRLVTGDNTVAQTVQVGELLTVFRDEEH